MQYATANKVFWGKSVEEAARDLQWRFSTAPAGDVQAVNWEALTIAAAWAVASLSLTGVERAKFLDVLGLESKIEPMGSRLVQKVYIGADKK